MDRLTKLAKEIKHSREVAKSYKESKTIEDLKTKLDNLIIKNEYNLIANEVVSASQKLDIEIVKKQTSFK